MSTVQKYPGNMTEEELHAAMKDLLGRGLKEGKLPVADLDALLAPLALTSEETERVHDCITQMGIDLIPEENGTPEEAETAAAERLLEAVKELLALDVLTARETEVLRLRFGLADGRIHSLEEVAQAFGVTRERIRIVESKAIRRHRGHRHRKKIRDFYL